MAEPTIVPENKRLLVAVCYVVTLLGGIILFLIAENDRALKFHAFQNIVLGVIMWVLWFISPVTLCLTGLVGLIVWLYCLYGAYMIYTKGDWRSLVAGFVDSSLMK
ncbi:MAG TPA: hypothetical protein VLT35_04305 [Methanocella sp.]|nr:hypothetical protein [Methanocella sp.]